MASILERTEYMTDEIRMRVYSSGKEVEYQGRFYRVEYVHLRGMDLLVKLDGIREQIDARHLACEPTVFKTSRTEL